jgi:hypothetical protein
MPRRRTFSGSIDGPLAIIRPAHSKKESKDMAWGLALERCMVDVSAVRAKIGFVGKQIAKVKELQGVVLAAVNNTQLEGTESCFGL